MDDTQDDAMGVPSARVVSALWASLVDGMYTVDLQGRLSMLNPAGQRLLGYTEGELLGRDVHEVVHHQTRAGQPIPRDTCPLLEVLRSGRATRVESDFFTCKDGRVIDVSYSSSPVLQDGEVTGAVVVFRDRTERRTVERRAQELSDEREQAGQEWQRNLLPSRLPDVPGVEVAVGFRPVGERALIGGDFYDVIESATGHLLVLGDVRGKGHGAAAIAAAVRYLLRGAAHHTADPRQLLQMVNQELRGHPSGRFCTLVLAATTPLDDGRLLAGVACAGHPRPVRVSADGTARPVGGSGPLLGVLDHVDVRVDEVVLEAGDRLVLFSDGLIDAGRLQGRPPNDVTALLAGTVASSAETVTLLEQRGGVLDVADAPDDVAILVARLTPASEHPAGPPRPAGDAPADPARIGDVEADFRDANELVLAGRPATEVLVAVQCECGHGTCSLLIDVPRADYDRVRRDDRQFLLVCGHEIPRAERIVERHEGFCVVRKHTQAGAQAERRA